MVSSLGARICHRLDAAAPLGGRASPILAGLSPESALREERLAVVHAVTSSFGYGGSDFGGMPVSAVDVVNLVKAGDYRMAAMSKGYGDFTAAWVKKDPGAYADFTNDWMALINRWAAAKVAAKSPTLSYVASGGMAGGGAYDGLARALRQGGPSAPVRRGDYDDLLARIFAAGGVVDITHGGPETPTLGQIITSPATAIPQALHEVGEIPSEVRKKLGLPDLPDPLAGFRSLEDVLKWVKAHQTELVVGVVMVGGLVVFGALLTALKAAPLALKGASMGVL